MTEAHLFTDENGVEQMTINDGKLVIAGLSVMASSDDHVFAMHGDIPVLTNALLQQSKQDSKLHSLIMSTALSILHGLPQLKPAFVAALEMDLRNGNMRVFEVDYTDGSHEEIKLH